MIPALIPVELFSTFEVGLFKICTGHFVFSRAVKRAVIRRINRAYIQAIDTQYFGSLVEQRFDHAGDLILPGSPLRHPRWRIGFNRYTAETHVFRCINQGNRIGSRHVIVHASIRSVFLHDIQITRFYPTVFAKAHLDAPLKTRPGRTEAILFRPADSQHHGSVDLFRHIGRDCHFSVRDTFSTKATTTEFGNEYQILHLNVDVGRQSRHYKRLALTRTVDKALAVLPIRKARTRFQCMM